MSSVTGMISPQRGFTLLIAVILSSVALSLGLALLDITYKQLVLSSTVKQSQYAFYAADSTLECALYLDQQLNAFNFTTPRDLSSDTCNGFSLTNYLTSTAVATRTTQFTVQCAGGELGDVVIFKNTNGKTDIFTTGYNDCTAGNQRRIERGLKLFY